ncbi:MAG: hypothetical protein JRI61_01510 [Deltaproteobacteria bacterium]|nr:hypothetical protein [Deltaproteobacteria bacterium]
MNRKPAKRFCAIPRFSLLSLIFSVVCLPLIAGAAEVGGRINTSVVWDRSHSPYSLTGDVRIGESPDKSGTVELKIEPGVEVKLNGFKIHAGSAPEKGGGGYKGRVVADQVKFVGKGGIELLFGDENLISESSFDRVNLVLGKNANTVSSGSIQNITMINANIIVQGGNWKIVGGKIINGSITHRNIGLPGLGGKTGRFLNFFMDMVTSP